MGVEREWTEGVDLECGEATGVVERRDPKENNSPHDFKNIVDPT